MENSLVHALTIRPIDWSDFNRDAELADGILARLDEDRDLLWRLLRAIPNDARLSSMCESLHPFDKLVVLDEPSCGVRIRLHIWNETNGELAHQHRFSFATRILAGSYDHTLYAGDVPDDVAAEFVQKHVGRDSAVENTASLAADVHPVLTQHLVAGDSYALHHTAFHAATPSAGTVSLFLRGPASNPFAAVADLERQALYWRIGRALESTDQITTKVMTPARLRAALDQLEEVGL